MASSSRPKRIYHVFLSFRGTDVRNNFLDHLYTALDLKGIYTYVDSEELRKGDQIASALMKAIEESQIAVIVFSEDYASSSWCLEEVAKIMECREERNLMVFPVFYKVDPREVRTPRAKYKDAMVKHESKFGENSEKVKRWKEALFHAGSLSGWHLKDGDDSEHIQRIVKEIATHLGRTPLHVAKHPVGINSRVLKLKSMLNLESDDSVLMVGLWGQGGIGKTTLAKAIYNDIFTQFEGSCFLANVRETSKGCEGLVTLQEKLLSEILLRKQRLVVSSVDAGTNLIRERLFCKKILLVLDDVDDICQLSTLAGEGKWFGNGSRIIFTTRDEHLLTTHGIDQDHVYEVKLLDVNEARELLTKHAFSTQQKLNIRTDLVDGVLNYTKGLPLALEVLGSFLCGRREHAWKSTLKKLSRIPNKSINDVLKISYDGLEENEKEIFLHIACFFKGWDSEYIKKALDSCNFEIAIGLEILIERSLISIEHEHIQMHDLIQLMGMDIVNKECRDDPRRRSKLWLYDDVLDVLSSDMGDCAVKAIVLNPPKLKEIRIDADAFTKMRRLRLLIMRNVHNSFQDPICLPNELRWFEWHGAPWIPQFSSGPKKLVGLDINESSMTVVPKQFKDFQQLKYLSFSKCESLVHIPDLSYTPNLEELELQNCKNLVEAHNSIAYHDKLQELDLSGCSELCVFPTVLKSKNLRVLDLDNCTKFERFPEIPHKLEGLKHLSLEGTAIKKLPESIENLVALEDMQLSNCKNLVSLPSSIYKLQNIDSLVLAGCTNLIEFPKYEDSAHSHMKFRLSNLSWLNLSECNLSEVEFLKNLSCFPSLKTLFLRENNITNLPTSINKRHQLDRLEVSNCHQLQEIPELPPSLRHFEANDCESLQKSGDFTSIHNFFRRTFTMAPDQCAFLFPSGEMPNWVLPVQDGSICFMASADLYDKFLGFCLCSVLGKDEQKKSLLLETVARINGKPRTHYKKIFVPLDSDHIWLQYFTRENLWSKVNFGQNDGSFLQFSLTISSKNLKKWGFRIICKPLEEDLKVLLPDKQLIDPALLYEVGHESTDFGAESSLVHEDNSIETNLQKDLQDCPMSTEKQSQIISESNHKIVLHQGMRNKTMLASNSTGRDAYGSVGLQLLLSE